MSDDLTDQKAFHAFWGFRYYTMRDAQLDAELETKEARLIAWRAWNGALTWNDIGNPYVTPQFRQPETPSVVLSSLQQAVRDYFALLDIEEETDDGRRFFPNRLGSCRVMDGVKMEAALRRMKELSK